MASPTELKSAIARARAHTDALFRLVRPGALYERPIPQRHRLIFYLGHLEAFDWNLIGSGPLNLRAFRPSFDRLFAFGIDPPAGRLPDDKPSDWPSVEEVLGYNRCVRDTLDPFLDKAPDILLHVALEHRLMHAETFAYLLHQLPLEAKVARPGPGVVSGPSPRPEMCVVPAGPATLGRGRQDDFGWDNEFEQHAVWVPAFAIRKYKVTNGEYLQFVRDGAGPPHFWIRRGDDWFCRTMFGEVPLPLDWPVYVTHCEAVAYARWAGKGLPSEAQFHRAACGAPAGPERLFPWGDQPPSAGCGNFDFHRWDPVSVTATPQGDSAFGVSQLVGNGWEWTSTAFEPFPGFQPFSFYRGYSAGFFDGDHYVLKGGSARTAGPLLRRSFRNWFRPDYPYIYAGFRLVET